MRASFAMRGASWTMCGGAAMPRSLPGRAGSTEHLSHRRSQCPRATSTRDGRRVHRTSAPQFRFDRVVGSIKCQRDPAASADVVEQRIRPDARGAAIDQVAERLGSQATLAPVTEHHGRRGAAAECLGLGNKGNVEDGEWRLPTLLGAALSLVEGRRLGIHRSSQRRNENERCVASPPQR